MLNILHICLITETLQTSFSLHKWLLGFYKFKLFFFFKYSVKKRYLYNFSTKKKNWYGVSSLPLPYFTFHYDEPGSESVGKS